ncbi:hypothetical protein EZV62_026524 [Acer yangbiense]|uniref:Uncharacterized protein n=1 Tax=Acer yangbiense TaxID=1000413 RepID=A0A5C7GRR6_9ROSI|nr:hypothetical protein EZV62_026524 [Acer yangbiense]
MASSSIVSDRSSHFPVTSTKLSPTINEQNESNTQDNVVVVSYPLKENTYPSELSIFTDVDVRVKHERKLKVFKQILIEVGEDPFEGLAMIDAVQRLGIDYHFQGEIEQILQRHYMIITNGSTTHHHQHNLQEIALRFRLLRQEGYNVPAGDVFNEFIRKNEDFEGKSHDRINVSEDITGLMGLYEASKLSGEGENVLDEAGNFSANLLNEWIKNKHDKLDHHCEAKVVENTLVYPHHKSLPRFMAKTLFLSNYQGENGWIHVLQELAIMDFNMVQSLYQKEIVQVSKWWKDLGLANKLEFARDQPIKWYIWSMASLTDPNLSEQRVDLTKPISLIYIIDDIFDVYGTVDELTLFTETITRWDLSAADQLPEYLRICFKALNDITDEISFKVYNKHGYNPVHSLRKAWASLCNAFLVEAKWFDSGHLPKAEEYLENGIVSSGVHVGLVHIFFLLGQNITKENVELIDNHPGLISSTATILRLWDDLGSAKDENQEGKDGSYIHYYMMENQDTTTAECARNHAIDKISNAWKSLNKQCLSPNPFSATFTRACLNLARMVPLMYGYDDNQRLPILEDYIKSLLFENTPTQGVY